MTPESTALLVVVIVVLVFVGLPILNWRRVRLDRAWHRMYIEKLARRKVAPQERQQQMPIANPSVTRTTEDWPRIIYQAGAFITGFLTFIGSWIYCIYTYGYLLGVGLGWLPSIIIAVIAGALWPLIAAVVVLIGLIILKGLS